MHTYNIELWGLDPLLSVHWTEDPNVENLNLYSLCTFIFLCLVVGWPLIQV